MTTAAALAGCASSQLNYNTMEIASTVESLQTRQVLYNISKFIDDPDTIPDQIVISSGNVSVTNSVTPNVSGTVTQANVVAAARSATRTVAKVLSTAGSDQWTESWGVSPISDGDALRRLRALYLFVAHHDQAELNEYPPQLVSFTPPSPDTWSKCRKWEDKVCDGPILVPDPFFQKKYHRILVNGKPNSALCPDGWLYYTGPSLLTGAPRPPPALLSPVFLGHFGNHDLFTTTEAMKRKCLSNFVLFILDAAGETASPSGGGGGGGGKGPKPTIQVVPPSTITPDQILPRQ